MKRNDDVLVLEVWRPQTEMRGNVVRVNRDAIAALQELQRATGLPASEIASKLILFAAERTEIKERR